MTKAIFKNGLEMDVIIKDGRSYLSYKKKEYYARFEIKKNNPVVSLYNIAEELDFIPKNMLSKKEHMFVTLNENISQELEKSKKELEDKENEEKRQRGLKKALMFTNQDDWDRVTEISIVFVYPATQEEYDSCNYKTEYKENLHYLAYFEKQIKIDIDTFRSSKINVSKLKKACHGDTIYYFINDKIENILLKIIEKNKKTKVTKKETKRKKEEDHYNKCLQEAKRKNKSVILKKYSDECNDDNESCNIDIIIEYINPDGTTKITRSHTW